MRALSTRKRRAMLSHVAAFTRSKIASSMPLTAASAGRHCDLAGTMPLDTVREGFFWSTAASFRPKTLLTPLPEHLFEDRGL
jgi:hypothetical protein